MKLITEQFWDLSINENNEDKQLYIEGIFLQAEVPNKNNRIYRLPLLEREANRYNEEFVKTNRALGELNHPKNPDPDPEKATHRVTELKQKGNDFYGKALILDTPKGQIVKALLNGGTKLGVSSRGMGSFEQVSGLNEVQDDYHLCCIDIVTNPSAPKAFVNGIMENVNWIVENGHFVKHQERFDSIKKKIHNAPKKRIDEISVKEFNKFLNELSNKI